MKLDQSDVFFDEEKYIIFPWLRDKTIATITALIHYVGELTIDQFNGVLSIH